MKRRLCEMSDVKDVKPEPDDMQPTVATVVAQQVAAALLAPLTGGSAARFGRVVFGEQEQQSVNTFLHQKLGKDSLARRPGPGGRKLTYIESCKAIELANRAFGFNGWSCHIVECKEEYKEKKGDRWSIGYSSLVRIELKDGTSHEDVGFGTSDGQRDLGAALEQSKKASISDARKRALRLFGEYLGNSCYDKDHIKDVNSNKPMAPLAAAPNVILPGQQQQQQVQSGGGAVPLGPNRQTSVPIGLQPPPQNQQPQAQQVAQQQRPPQAFQQQPNVQQPMQQQPEVQNGPRPPPNQQQPHQPVQHQQNQQQERQPIQQQRPQTPQQSIQPHQQQQRQPQQPQQWKPPQVLRNPQPTNYNSSMQQQTQGLSTASSRNPTMQTAASKSMSSGYIASPSTATASASSSPFRPQPQRWISSNAPPPPRMMTSNYPPTIVKTEQPSTVQAHANAQYNMEDLSLSQFDYDPKVENNNPAKKMRS
ncbi:hypothetical protein PInf_012224 [Phytophthora infestans]|nr:hypothetical protein PInf_012224 [Phytophthora infestans]